jgi:hypothetical protein
MSSLDKSSVRSSIEEDPVPAGACLGGFAILSSVKASLLPSGSRPRRILAGLNQGALMNLDLRHDLQRQLGVYEREIAGMIRGCASRIRSAIDVGAGDGYYTLYFLMRTAATVVAAFEPSESSRERLLANLRLNGLEHNSRLLLSPQAVGRKTSDGVATLKAMSDRIQTPCFIKVDVEGAEVDVLAGASALLAEPRALWLIETHSRELEAQCIDLLVGAGHEIVIVSNAWWRAVVPERRLLPHNRWLFARKADPVPLLTTGTSDD